MVLLGDTGFTLTGNHPGRSWDVSLRVRGEEQGIPRPGGMERGRGCQEGAGGGAEVEPPSEQSPPGRWGPHPALSTHRGLLSGGVGGKGLEELGKRGER